jgi:hypothetical protein
VVLMSSDVESIGRDDHVAKIPVWLKSPSDTLHLTKLQRRATARLSPEKVTKLSAIRKSYDVAEPASPDNESHSPLPPRTSLSMERRVNFLSNTSYTTSYLPFVLPFFEEPSSLPVEAGNSGRLIPSPVIS